MHHPTNEKILQSHHLLDSLSSPSVASPTPKPTATAVAKLPSLVSSHDDLDAAWASLLLSGKKKLETFRACESGQTRQAKREASVEYVSISHEGLSGQGRI